MEDWSICVLQWGPRMSKSVDPKKRVMWERLGDLDLAVNEPRLREEEDSNPWPIHCLVLQGMWSTVGTPFVTQV